MPSQNLLPETIVSVEELMAFLATRYSEANPRILTGADAVSIPEVPEEEVQKKNPQRDAYRGSTTTRCINDLGPTVHYVNWTNEGGFILQAGSASGIRPGAIFTVYTDSLLSQQLGQLKVDRTLAFTSSMSVCPGCPEFTLATSPGYAARATLGQTPDVHVYIPFYSDLLPLWDVLYQEIAEPMQMGDIIIDYVDRSQADRADLCLDLTAAGQITFSILSNGTDPSDRLVIPQEVLIEPYRIYSILQNAAHFCYHLYRTSSSHELGKVNVECNQLFNGGFVDVEGRKNGVFIPERVGVNQIRPDNSLTVYVTDSDVAVKRNYYGWRLLNHTNHDLYVNVFFFDLDDMSIVEVYPTRANEAVLPKAAEGVPGSLTIGYQSTGSYPRYFTVPDGLDASHGILKVFLSTQRIDLSHVPRPHSAFEEGQCRGDIEIERVVELCQWDTISIPVRIERRRPAEA